MAGYTKIFGAMLDSTVWQLSKEGRLLWITMLLKKDGSQIVRAAVPGLAHAARLTLAETEAALKELQSPDAYSQSKEHEGRRVLKVDGGWFIVNGAKYRELMTSDDRRAYKAMKQAEYRNKKRCGPTAREKAYEKTLDEEGPEAADKLMESSTDYSAPDKVRQTRE